MTTVCVGWSQARGLSKFGGCVIGTDRPTACGLFGGRACLRLVVVAVLARHCFGVYTTFKVRGYWLMVCVRHVRVFTTRVLTWYVWRIFVWGGGVAFLVSGHHHVSILGVFTRVGASVGKLIVLSYDHHPHAWELLFVCG